MYPHGIFQSIVGNGVSVVPEVIMVSPSPTSSPTPTPPPREGVWGLYMPDKIHDARSGLVHPLHDDNVQEARYTLPMQNSPSRLRDIPLTPFGCRPLVQGEDSTVGKSTTTVSKVAMERTPTLKKVKLAPMMLTNLQKYTDAGSDIDIDNYLTSRNVNAWPLPNAEKQAEAISLLSDWYALFTNHIAANDDGCVVVSEENIRSEVVQQLINPINVLLKIRYDSEVVDVDMRWKYSTERTKKMIAGSTVVNDDTRRGGDTDLVFFPGAVCEIKTSWAVSLGQILSMLCDPGLVDNDGVVKDKFDRTAQSKLLNQLWVQLDTYNCKWGFITNGEVYVVFCKANQDTLALSLWDDWVSRDFHKTILGLSYVVVDARSITDEDEIQKRIDNLCGELTSPFSKQQPSKNRKVYHTLQKIRKIHEERKKKELRKVKHLDRLDDIHEAAVQVLDDTDHTYKGRNTAPELQSPDTHRTRTASGTLQPHVPGKWAE
ncbi:hypothetical protein BDQ17DRAFT_1413671 [Cyathus striatus]|nr:hypothetical protein BDQ17DRAFT_1413671 [Cyathus striatus]